MMMQIQKLNRGQRVLIFILLMGGGLFLILAVTALVVLLTVNSAPREVAVALRDGVAVAEFAQLPDEDAYPAAVAVSPDGVVYSASYATGAIWRVDPLGVVELEDSRELIGSVSGLAFAPDGTLYALDRLDSNPGAAGGIVWQIDPDGMIRNFGTIQDDNGGGFIAPDDLAVDGENRVYVTDRGRREIWRFMPDGAASLWWSPAETEAVIPTGIVYDPATDSLLVTDTVHDTIHRISADGLSVTRLYAYAAGGEFDPPGLDGIALAPDGRVYVAAFGIRAVAQLDGDQLILLAGNFRGASDVDFYDGRLYVTNFDQRSLVLPGITPQLPFALDVVTFDE